MKVELIIEKGTDGDDLDGRVILGGSIIVGQADNLEELIPTMKELVVDLASNELKEVKKWEPLREGKVEFDIQYDLVAFFSAFNYLIISEVAKKAEMNPSLVRAYSKGIKYPSEKQVKKLEEAVHNLAREMGAVTLIAP
jgi:hypothetical protein